VFAVSADLRQHLIAEGFAASAVTTIYNGIEIGRPVDVEGRAAARAALAVSPETLVVGTIARLDPVKDLGTLIKAVAGMPVSIPKLLLIVGDGSERDRLEREATATGQRANVRFLGHQDDARRWLAGCDVYVNTSVSEGVSLTILEGMAAALPVIATSVGGTPEVINDECGRLVRPRSHEAVMAALVELAGQPELRRRLGAQARRRVRELFSIDQMVRAYSDVYLRV
jgi:glycosyltransferase involved in cell wall biosynthesis